MQLIEPEVWQRQWDELWEEVFATAMNRHDEEDQTTES